MNDRSVTPAAAGLFDAHGRRIPPAALKAAAHGQSRRYFDFARPKVDYRLIHERLARFLLAGDIIPPADFELRAEAILRRLRDDPLTRGITAGTGVPLMLPRASYPDYGDALEHIYLAGVRASFGHACPDYQFVNHHKSGLAGKLGIAPGSRHERLLQAMRQAPQVGYFFPCLTEYSVPAALEQMPFLPEQFMLAGGFDTSAALIGTPDLLLRRDGYPPLLWLSALSGETEGVGYHFEAYGYNLTFNRRPHLNHAAEYWASGLVVLG